MVDYLKKKDVSVHMLVVCVWGFFFVFWFFFLIISDIQNHARIIFTSPHYSSD